MCPVIATPLESRGVGVKRKALLPTWMLAVVGASVTLATGTGFTTTVIGVVAPIPSTVAVMVAVPTLTAVMLADPAVPAATVATAGLFDDQTMVRWPSPSGAFDASKACTVAGKVCVGCTLGGCVAETCTDATGTRLTVKGIAVDVFPSEVAVMFVVPEATAVTSPVLLTVATLVCDDVYVTAAQTGVITGVAAVESTPATVPFAGFTVAFATLPLDQENV